MAHGPARAYQSGFAGVHNAGVPFLAGRIPRRHRAAAPNRGSVILQMKFLLLLALAVPFLFGCQPEPSKLVGGSVRHDTGGFAVTYTPPGGGTVEITDNREYVATTQPSIFSTGDVTKLRTQGTTGEDDIGGVSFDTKRIPKTATAWGLIGLLVLLTVGCYFLHSYIGVAAGICGIVIAFIWPQLLVWMAVGTLAVMLYSQRKVIRQLIKGTSDALEKIPDVPVTVETTAQDVAKGEMKMAQDQSVQQVVKANRQGS